MGLYALLAAALLVVVGLAGYAAATHWLLSGPRLRAWINTTPESTWIDWDEAVSLWPGTVRLKNLRIRGSDQNVQWIIRLARARADFSLLALTRRTFRVERVSGTGLSFHLRQKLDASDPHNPPSSWLPPVLGFSDPPLRRKSSAEAGASAEQGNPWTVDVSRISLDRFEELWIDGYRFQGLARLTGEFLLRPGMRARIGPADIDFQEGELALAAHPIMSPLAGRLHAAFDEFDPRLIQGDAVWRSVSAKVDLHGPVPGLEFLNVLLRHSKEPRFSKGRGVLAIAGTIDHGNAAGRVHLAASGFQAHLKNVDLFGTLRSTVRIPSWNLERGGMDVSSSSLALSDVVAAGVEGLPGWWGRLDLSEARIEKGLHAKVKLECRDARPLFAAFDTSLPSWTGGLRTLEGLTATANVELSSERARIGGLAAQGGKYRIFGEYARLGDVERAAFLIEGGILTVGVGSDDGQASVHLFAARRWFQKEKALVAADSRAAGEPAPRRNVTSVTRRHKGP